MLKKSFFLVITWMLLTGTAVDAKNRVMIDLSKHYNVDGISWESNKKDGDLDRVGNTYVADLLPDKGKTWAVKNSKYGSISFFAPPIEDGKKNFISFNNQKIKVEEKQYNKLFILITSVNGNYEKNIELVYSDKTIEKKQIKVTDWCMESEYNEETAFIFDHRHTQDDNEIIDISTKLWMIAIDVNKKKKLKQIILVGNNIDLLITAMSLSE